MILGPGWAAHVGLSQGRFAALGYIYVSALIASLQAFIQPQFDAQAATLHSRQHVLASNLITAAGKGKRVIVADDALFHMTQRCRQIDLRTERPVQVRYRRRGCRESLIPFWPVLFFQKRIGTGCVLDFGQP